MNALSPKWACIWIYWNTNVYVKIEHTYLPVWFHMNSKLWWLYKKHIFTIVESLLTDSCQIWHFIGWKKEQRQLPWKNKKHLFQVPLQKILGEGKIEIQLFHYTLCNTSKNDIMPSLIESFMILWEFSGIAKWQRKHGPNFSLCWASTWESLGIQFKIVF